MTATPTRDELVAKVASAQAQHDLILAELDSDHNMSPRAYPAAYRRLQYAQAALYAYDAACWELVRKLLDACCVVWEWEPGTYYCHIFGRSCNEEPCGVGTTRSEALLDLARKVAALNDTTPAGEAGEERAT